MKTYRIYIKNTKGEIIFDQIVSGLNGYSEAEKFAMRKSRELGDTTHGYDFRIIAK